MYICRSDHCFSTRFKAAINYTESPQALDKACEPPIWSESVPDRSARLVSIFLKAADLGHAAKPLAAGV